MSLQNFVNMKLAAEDKQEVTQGYPLALKNCKRYKQMKELKVYGNSQHDFQNLIDENTITKDIFIDENGIQYDLSSSRNGGLSDYIEIDISKSYGYTNDNWTNTDSNVRISFYDSEKTFISQFIKMTNKYTKVTNTTVTIPENTVYVRVGYCGDISFYINQPDPNAPLDVLGVWGPSINIADVHQAFTGYAAYAEVEEDGRQCIRFQSNNTTAYNPGFKENTQYAISCWAKCVRRSGYSESQYPKSDTILAVRYTDGTYSYMMCSSDSLWRKCTFITAAGKTVKSIGSNCYHWTTYVYVDINTFQIEEGNIVNDYEPYGKYKISVVFKGKNLLKDIREIYKELYGYGEIFEDGRSCIRFTSAKTQQYTGISFKENTQYTFSFYGKCVKKPDEITEGAGADYPLAIFYTDGTKTNLRCVRDGVWRKLTITSEANKTIKAIGTPVHEYRNYLYIDINTFLIDEGATVRDYEPYVEPVITNIFLDEPLRKLGDYADYIDYKNKKVVRNIKQFILKGGEIDYIGHNTIGNYLMCYTTDNNTDVNSVYFSQHIPNQYPELCSHFITTSYRISSTATPLNSWFIRAAGDIVINIALETFASDGVEATIEDVNNWLQTQYQNGTPVTFNYILNEPIKEPLDIELPKLTSKTTIIEVNADVNLLPSNIYSKYIKR